ncbi:hypothetical protein ES708_21083 [subsurface metagenome]
MEITVVIPTFKVDEPAWFTVTMEANDDLGKLVVASLEGEKIAGTLETEEGSDLTFTSTGDVFQSEEFTMGDVIANFRGTFTSPGIYLTTIKVRTSEGGDLLCSQDITIVVEGDPLIVGDIYGGGVVAYTDGTGHGLIAALADQSDGIYWHATNDGETGATETVLGTGKANTDKIIELYGLEDNAAKLCLDYTNADTGTGSFSDWSLPSKDELHQLWLNRDAIGGFAATIYWSSSEITADKAWSQQFSDGDQYDSKNKEDPAPVRAVRYF